MKKAAKKIFEDFIADDALDSVNVDAKVRVSVVEALKNGATANTFTAAQQQILGKEEGTICFRQVRDYA